jgi:hypothetical protein
MVKLLLDHGVDPNILGDISLDYSTIPTEMNLQGGEYGSALNTASHFKHFKNIKLLLEDGPI